MGTWNWTPIVALVLAPFLAFSASAGEADEANLEILVSTIQANKKAFVAVNLPLEDEEARDFWPIYDRYQSDLATVRDRFVRLIADYTANFGTMSDAKAREIVETYLGLERDRADLRQRYLKPFSEVLPGRKLARLYQIENKIDAVLRYRLARDIPVLEQSPSPPD